MPNIHTETVTAGTTSDPVVLREFSFGKFPTEVVVAVICTTANTIEFTLDSHEAVAADSAVWIPWDHGSVVTDTAAVFPWAVTAIRCDNTGASNSTFKVSV